MSMKSMLHQLLKKMRFLAVGNQTDFNSPDHTQKEFTVLLSCGFPDQSYDDFYNAQIMLS